MLGRTSTKKAGIRRQKKETERKILCLVLLAFRGALHRHHSFSGDLHDNGSTNDNNLDENQEKKDAHSKDAANV